MGFTKRRIEEAEALENDAIVVLIAAGSLNECEIHGTYYEGGSDVEDAYKLANTRISNGLLELPNGVSRRDFTDAIKAAYDDHSLSGECPSCPGWD